MHLARLAASAIVLLAAAGCAPVDSIDLGALETSASGSATGAGGSGQGGAVSTSTSSPSGAGGQAASSSSSASGSGSSSSSSGGGTGSTADGGACTASAQCVSGVCKSGVCQKPTCSDLVRNGGESDVDCGQACAAELAIYDCPSGAACAGNDDCYNDKCVSHVCAQSLLGEFCITTADCVAGLECDRDVTGKCQVASP